MCILCNMSRRYPVRKKQVLLYQGEASQFVYVINKGLVKAYTTLSNGSEVIIALFGPNDYFPASFNLEKAPVSLFYYETMTDGEITSLGAEEFNKYREERPSEYIEASKRYLGALLHINALVQLQAFDKVAYTLQHLAIRFGVPLRGNIFTRIDVKLTQQDLASLCDLSRETVSIELTKLKTKNAVVEKNKLYSVNLSILTILIDDDSLIGIEL